jgi:cyclase
MCSQGFADEKRAVLRQVAPGLYFNHDQLVSNSVVLVTDEGVLVVDSRMHPDDADSLIEDIRKITDKPVKWLINSQFHGDHMMGNSSFKSAGAMIVAHRDTARIMEQKFDREIEKRLPYFERLGYGDRSVELVMPDVLFDERLTIKLGATVVEVLYLGTGQNAGDTIVWFPDSRIAFSSGTFGRQTWSNMEYTPSLDQWLETMTELRKLDVDAYLPPHGDIGSKADLDATATLFSKMNEVIKNGIENGQSIDDIVTGNLFDEYSEWRNYNLREKNLRSLYHLETTGVAPYFSN